MKRISFVILIILSLSSGVTAQNVDDALRYSQIFYGGTARFMSMGGAFTALGGDISTLSQNPAGIGVFRASELTLSPQLFHNTTKAGFYGRNTDFIYNFNLSQAGIVSNLISNSSGLISLNVGYSFNKTNNLNQTVRIQGFNTNSSMADFWEQNVNFRNNGSGVYFEDLLGNNGPYETFVIDTVTGSGGNQYGTVFSRYGDNPSSVYGQNVRRLITNEGYTGEHAISIGGNYENKVFFGFTVGINKIKYTGHYEHLESVDPSYQGTFEDFTYTDHFENKGTGFSLKAGVIVKPIEAIRIGVAFHSPTWYRIDEYLYDSYSSNFTGFETATFTSNPSRYEYALATPFRALAGIGIQIGKIGLISADYEFVDYSTVKFSETGDDYDYSVKNLELRNSFSAAHNLRFGGELRLDKLYLRGGYGYYGKAFAEGDANDELDYRSISAGIGFREKRVSIDFGFTNYMYDQNYLLYPLSGSSFNPASAILSSDKNMFTLTLGYKFGY